MKILEITKGEWIQVGTHKYPSIDVVYVKSEDGRILATVHGLSDGKNNEQKSVEAESNTKLITDAGNTYNKCGVLPSDLLEQRDELLEALNYSIRFIKRCPLINEDQYPKGLEKWELLIKKATE